jgi:hypothetical protein
MATVTTSIDSTTGGVKIAWTVPSDGSSTIDAYTIEIANEDQSAWLPDTVNCNGALPAIVS